MIIVNVFVYVFKSRVCFVVNVISSILMVGVEKTKIFNFFNAVFGKFTQ